MLEAMLHLIYDAQTHRYVLVQTNELENYHQQFFRHAWKTPSMADIVIFSLIMLYLGFLIPMTLFNLSKPNGGMNRVSVQ